ncbi:hypothetical protein [Leifsonia sp. TF02-11]|uniref:hypothetical protein n=1 Tax=Leifsonia sp. TF02-11 TaxID=2815212 RepID=UPI001AA1B199|nr:hypothetical protein [Leifsonia sp. TF02-11]MBO1739655.1 hypothetical protein [Leifsonia sp. TF02-11]
MKKLALGAVLLVVGLALTACSAAAAPKTAPTHTPIPVAEDAALIAKRIKGCSDVQSADIAKGGPALASTATCTIDGHTVNINSWASSDDANLDTVLAQDARDVYYARGDAWTVTLGDDPTLQYQLTNQADKLLADAFGGPNASPADASAEQHVAKVAVASLGGQVHHFTP